MRGRRESQVSMLVFVFLEERVSTDYPLRTIKLVAEGALDELSTEFDLTYSTVGRLPPYPRSVG